MRVDVDRRSTFSRDPSVVEPYERVIPPLSQVGLSDVKCADLNRLADQLRLSPARYRYLDYLLSFYLRVRL